jgi:hypothetical protein
LHRANDGWLLEEDDIQRSPHKQADGSRHVRVQHGSTRIRRSGVRIPSVETIPAEPEDASADEGEQDIVRLEVLSVVLEARANPVCCHETSSAGRYVNNVTARVIDDTTLEEPAATPEAVCA